MKAPLNAFLFSLIFVGIGFFSSSCASKKPIRSFSTPENAFRTWEYAAAQMDLATLLESYALSARPSVEDELARSSREGLLQMQKETKRTDFVIEKVVFEEDLAYLRVKRKKGPITEIEVVTMIKEGENWKLLP